jgi:butyryl-CoA dehydrogenase
MMDFTFTQEQLLVQKMAREFAQKELAPIAAEIDENARFPLETVEKLRANGMLGMTIPREYGGAGVDTLAYVLAEEEISKVCMSSAAILGGQNSLCSWALLNKGTAAQKEKYLRAMGTGEKLAAFATTEVNAGSDVSGQQTTAVADGDEWVLNGSKIFITNGGYADFYLILAVTDRTKGSKGFSVFIVDADAPGFTTGPKDNKMGQRASATTELIFQNCRIPRENLLGELGGGFKIVMQSLDSGRISVAAQCVGLAQGALDEAVKYIQQRKQFGKPLAANQYLRFTIADMATRLDAARLLVYRAADEKMRGKVNNKDAAMAKLFASQTCAWICKKSLNMFGGYGYTKEFAIERMYRDAAIVECYEGSAEVQRMVISGQVLK